MTSYKENTKKIKELADYLDRDYERDSASILRKLIVIRIRGGSRKDFDKLEKHLSSKK